MEVITNPTDVQDLCTVKVTSLARLPNFHMQELSEGSVMSDQEVITV